MESLDQVPRISFSTRGIPYLDNWLIMREYLIIALTRQTKHFARQRISYPKNWVDSIGLFDSLSSQIVYCT